MGDAPAVSQDFDGFLETWDLQCFHCVLLSACLRRGISVTKGQYDTRDYTHDEREAERSLYNGKHSFLFLSLSLFYRLELNGNRL